MNTEQETPITRKQAAEFLTENFFAVSHKTLSTWATNGNGPEFIKVRNKRVLYYPSTLTNWATSQMSKPAATTAGHKL